MVLRDKVSFKVIIIFYATPSHALCCHQQIVGVCTEELQAAQQWNGQGILELLRGVHV